MEEKLLDWRFSLRSQPNIPLLFPAADLSGLVVLEFWAPWCGPCRIIAPVLKQLEETGQVTVIKVNMDEQFEVGAALDVLAIPTLILVQDGVELARNVGTTTLPKLCQWVHTHSTEGAS